MKVKTPIYRMKEGLQRPLKVVQRVTPLQLDRKLLPQPGGGLIAKGSARLKRRSSRVTMGSADLFLRTKHNCPTLLGMRKEIQVLAENQGLCI